MTEFPSTYWHDGGTSLLFVGTAESLQLVVRLYGRERACSTTLEAAREYRDTKKSPAIEAAVNSLRDEIHAELLSEAEVDGAGRAVSRSQAA